MFGGIILWLFVSLLCWVFPYEQSTQNRLANRCGAKPKYRMKEVDNEGELFFTDATDFNEAFKF